MHRSALSYPRVPSVNAILPGGKTCAIASRAYIQINADLAKKWPSIQAAQILCLDAADGRTRRKLGELSAGTGPEPAALRQRWPKRRGSFAALFLLALQTPHQLPLWPCQVPPDLDTLLAAMNLHTLPLTSTCPTPAPLCRS